MAERPVGTTTSSSVALGSEAGDGFLRGDAGAEADLEEEALGRAKAVLPDKSSDFEFAVVDAVGAGEPVARGAPLDSRMAFWIFRWNSSSASESSSSSTSGLGLGGRRDRARALGSRRKQ